MKTACLFTTLVAGGLAVFSLAAVELQPFRVEESRSAAIAPDKIGRVPDKLDLILTLKGPEADASVRYGNLKLIEAVDDKGTSLIPTDDPFHRALEFKEYHNAFFRNHDIQNKKQPDAPQVKIELNPTKRSATKITRLRGSFDLAQQGTIKDVELTGLDKPGTYKLNIPPEAGVGISITIDAKKQSIGLQISGDESAMESIEVLDASGKVVNNGVSSWSFGNMEHKSIDLDKPLDATMKLVTKVSINRKIVKVPFDLKDIPLP